jgi:LPS export ABC transporter protein LptC
VRLAAGGKEQRMKRVRVLATLFVVAVAALGVWVASTGTRSGRTNTDTSETSSSAYDYEARDVVVRQMAPDGTLQYELTAKKVIQQPQSGQISAQDLVMHHDPAGSVPGGPNRWTLRADGADLPEPGGAITLKGDVRAAGRPENSQARVSLATEQLTYNLGTHDLSIDTPVDYTWGNSTLHCARLRMNTRLGTVVQSKCNGIFVP